MPTKTKPKTKPATKPAAARKQPTYQAQKDGTATKTAPGKLPKTPKDGTERHIILHGKKYLQVWIDGEWCFATRNFAPHGKTTYTYTGKAPPDAKDGIASGLDDIIAQDVEDQVRDKVANALTDLLGQCARLHTFYRKGSQPRKNNRAMIDIIARRLKEEMTE
ncbi:MAG: hypothetical protein ACR2PR_09370 [Pseudohongiellaceae bacterium]